MVTEKSKNIGLFEPVRKQDFKVLSSQDSPLFGLDTKQLHRTGVEQAVRDYFKQHRTSRVKRFVNG
jgi:hypothetical protein